MNDAEYETQLARLRALAGVWMKPLGLLWWRKIDMAYVRDSGDYSVDGEPSPNGCANTKADWRYLHATITWNIPVVAEQSDDELEYIFVHECCHILLNETRDLINKDQLRNDRDDWHAHEERVVSTVAQAFIWTRDMAKEPG